MLEVRMTKRMGRGVFTLKAIKAGTAVLIDPLLIIPKKDQDALIGTMIENYHFAFGEDESAIALGLTSLLNHSKRPNCAFEVSEDFKEVVVSSIKDIPAGSQLFIDYGWEENNF